jgi:hypothetical protein
MELVGLDLKIVRNMMRIVNVLIVKMIILLSLDIVDIIFYLVAELKKLIIHAKTVLHHLKV